MMWHTRNRRCWREKLGVPTMWSINLPGVQMSISTLLEPPYKLQRSLMSAWSVMKEVAPYTSVWSWTNWDCSWAKECCPVAVPICRIEMA